MAEKLKTILSIDGGGIRGIIPALVLAAIEERAAEIENNGRETIPTAELFDLIAGTSTGGILALGLTRPDPEAEGQPRYTAAELVQLYEREGRYIFDRSLRRRIRSFDGWIDEKYSSRGIEEVLGRYFENTRLSEALKPVLIPSYDMQGTRVYWQALRDADPNEEPPEREGGHPRFFKSDRANPEEAPQEDYLMRDVARATSAAPTYFEPLETQFNVLSDEPLFETLVDGGVFANNPAMCAYAEVRRRHNGDILVVSLGTGGLTDPLEHEEARDWGKLEWGETLLRIILDGASDTVDYQLRQLLPNNREDRLYYRFQPRLLTGLDKMDDTKSSTLLALKRTAETFIETHDDDLTELCACLTNSL